MTASTQEYSVVAIYDSHVGAEAAIKALKKAGIDMKALSIIAKDFQTAEHAVGFYTAGDRMMFWGGRGAIWGSLWGMLFGGAFLFIPTIGPLIVMGPLVGWVVGALEGAVVGATAGVVAAALTNLGIPKESVIRYELEVKAGRFVVLAHGSAEMVELARGILSTTGASQLAAHVLGRMELVTKARIMRLLSDEEIARVSTAESALHLADGDEYLDLEHLDQGVRRAGSAQPSMGQLLPRRAVHDKTWRSLLMELAAKPAPASGPQAAEQPRTS